MLLALGGTASLLRIRGVSGDLVPILAFRWSAPVAPPAPPPPLLAPTAEPSTAAPAAPVSPAPTGVGDTPRATPKPTRRPGDFPQFLGPSRDGSVHGVRLARDWSTRPPRKLWRQRIGEGWSGFAVAGDLAVTQEQRGGEESVVAYELVTGRVRWSHADPARYETTIGGVGPRATPTIADGRVFTLGATGILNALDLATGHRLWTRQVLDENNARPPLVGQELFPALAERPRGRERGRSRRGGPSSPTTPRPASPPGERATTAPATARPFSPSFGAGPRS